MGLDERTPAIDDPSDRERSAQPQEKEGPEGKLIAIAEATLNRVMDHRKGWPEGRPADQQEGQRRTAGEAGPDSDTLLVNGLHRVARC